MSTSSNVSLIPIIRLVTLCSWELLDIRVMTLLSQLDPVHRFSKYGSFRSLVWSIRRKDGVVVSSFILVL